MSCKVASGITNSCADLLKSGGIGKDFWVGYKSTLDTQISLAQAADISQLDFGAYGGLYLMEGTKFAHSAGWEIVRGAGGTLAFKHTVAVKLLPSTTAEDLTLQKLAQGDDIFIVAEDNNNEFFIYGAGKGLSVVSGTQNTGQASDSDIFASIVLEGSEKTIPLRFALGGGYDATLAYLRALQQ